MECIIPLESLEMGEPPKNSNHRKVSNLSAGRQSLRNNIHHIKQQNKSILLLLILILVSFEVLYNIFGDKTCENDSKTSLKSSFMPQIERNVS